MTTACRSLLEDVEKMRPPVGLLVRCLHRGSLIAACGAAACFFLGPAGTAGELGLAREQRLQELIQVLVDEHGFDPDQVTTVLRDLSPDQRVLRLMAPPSFERTSPDSWQAYRDNHVSQMRIEDGRDFLRKHRKTLAKAEGEYGVPASIITAILGIETNYGSYTGNFNTLRSLYTLALFLPARSQEFRDHLIGLFLLARQQRADIRSYQGSYAGAVGLPQFMPSSWMHYAVDFNDDGQVDLLTSYEDAIGSIAAYLRSFGWVSGEPVALKIQNLDPLRASSFTSGRLGLEPSLTNDQLRLLAVTLHEGDLPPQLATLILLATPEKPVDYWLAYKNFYAITRYNQSSFYAMSVFLLAQSISR